MAIINNIENLATVEYDGQPIASNSVNTILLLPPLIVKAVDKLTASIGDTLTYTITITNQSLDPITSLPFSDTIAPGATYVADSFTLNGTGVTPTIADTTLEYTIPTIGASDVATITFQVEVIGGEI